MPPIFRPRCWQKRRQARLLLIGPGSISAATLITASDGPVGHRRKRALLAPGGSLDFSNAYNFSSGTGSYAVGLHGGYGYVSASRWLVGWEGDVSFPNFLGANHTFASTLTGQANYLERVEYSGSLRGRVGYAPGNWLFYATAGLAYSFDQFSRTQLAGMPTGGSAPPGTLENVFLVPRIGTVAGGGIEVALTPQWAARLEYLFTDYATRELSLFRRRLSDLILICKRKLFVSASITSLAMTALIPTYLAKAFPTLSSIGSRFTARLLLSNNTTVPFTRRILERTASSRTRDVKAGTSCTSSE